MAPELPEERLLHLIKSKGKPAAQTGHVRNAPERPSGPSFVKRLADLKALGPSHLAHANKFLGLALAVSTVYLVSSFAFPYKTGREASASPVKEAHAAPSVPALKDYSAYSQAMASKKLFFSDAVSDVADVGQLSDLSDRFSLVGIIAGESPQAVIEDKKAGKTYYLYKGASFNGTVVEDIGSGRVILDCKGERISLVL